MHNIFNKLHGLFSFRGSDRTAKAKKNIILLFLIHGINFLAMMLIVPLTLDYLGAEEYGIWMTLSSILVWVTYLDLGMGNGLRVKLAESLAHNDYKTSKIYISTSYAILSSGMFILFLLFLAVNPFLDWSVLLNTNVNLKDELSSLVLWVFGLFLLQFVLKLITYIISADQRTSITGALNLTVNIITVVFLFFLTRSGRGSLFNIGVGVSFIPVLVFLFASYFFFKSLFKNISPSVKYIDLKYSRDLIVLGGQFFVIQAAALVVFATDNMIITQLFSPADVAVYNIAYRYFNFIPMLFGIFLNPLLPAYTEAYAKNDFNWIRRATNKLLKTWLILSIVAVVMVIVSGIAYRIWIGNEIKVPLTLSIAMGVFVIISNWNNVFTYFLNGVGKIRLQFYSAIIVALLNIPISILFAKYLNMGITGVITGTIFCLIMGGGVWAPLQYYKIINRKDKGIWSK